MDQKGSLYRYTCVCARWGKVNLTTKCFFQTVMPAFVATSMSKIRKASFFVPDPVSFTRAAVATVGIQNETMGCFAHALQVSYATCPHMASYVSIWPAATCPHMASCSH